MTEYTIPANGKFGPRTRVAVNGNQQDIAAETAFTPEEGVLEALGTAGVEVEEVIDYGDPTGRIIISGTGSGTYLSINGKSQYLAFNELFTPTASELSAIENSNLPFRREYEAVGIEGQPVPPTLDYIVADETFATDASSSNLGDWYNMAGGAEVTGGKLVLNGGTAVSPTLFDPAYTYVLEVGVESVAGQIEISLSGDGGLITTLTETGTHQIEFRTRTASTPLLIINDGSGGAVINSLEVISELLDIVPPTITSSAAISSPEGILSHTLTADETVTWSKIGGDDAAVFTLVGNTLSWTSGASDYEAPTDADLDNVYAVTVRATDMGGNTTDQEIVVTVTDQEVEDPYGPELWPQPSFDGTEGLTLSGWSVAGGEIASNASGGTMRGTPTETLDAGDYRITATFRNPDFAPIPIQIGGTSAGALGFGGTKDTIVTIASVSIQEITLRDTENYDFWVEAFSVKKVL